MCCWDGNFNFSSFSTKALNCMLNLLEPLKRESGISAELKLSFKLWSWRNFCFQFHSKANRGEFARPKKESLKSYAMTAAKPLQCLSSLKQANLFTVAHASQNAFQIDEDVPVWTSVLTRKTHGQGEEAISRAKKRKNQLAFSKNTSLKNFREADLREHSFWNGCYADSVISIY